MEDIASSGEHLCVLVHGLWGNPQHMASVAKALREKYPDGSLHILVAKRNSGSFTYDGIERGGERVCQEIEEEIKDLAGKGQHIKKLSVVGYSLGGLVARYAIGLLDSKGWFEKVEPMNFVTFASPHLGVRTPLRGIHNHVWNILGARTLSTSGRQLFTIDNFRNTSRPLLAVIADPDSIFMRGLGKFKRRTLYSNIVNDRSAVYYTTGIAKTDPFNDFSKIKINYLPGYSDVILNPSTPILPVPKTPSSPVPFFKTLRPFLNRLFFGLAMALLIPLGVTFFLINSVVQSVRSRQRIKLHETGRAGIEIGNYRMPLFITEGMRDVRREFEGVYEEFNSAQRNEYLGDSSGDDVEGMGERPESPVNSRSTNVPKIRISSESDTSLSSVEKIAQGDSTMESGNKSSELHFPTLALAPYQFAMIAALDDVGEGKDKGFRKYPVHIHKSAHSHAAIIVRTPGKDAFSEGWIVFKHWLDGEFLI